MADVMSAFLSGHQAGQAEQQHAQQLEENKLRTMVLKHEIDRLKIDDQVRARDLAKQNAEILHGQPAADIPSDTVTTQQPNLPSQSLAGVVNGLVGSRLSGNMGGTPDVPAAETPTFTPAPAAQDTATGTNPVQSRVARAVDIPGVPGLNVPGVSVRPKSMEDLVRSQIATEMAKPYTLNEGARRFVGASEVARGGTKDVVIPRGGSLVNPEKPGAPPIAIGQPPAKRGRPVAGKIDGKGATIYGTFDPDTEKITVGGVDVTGRFVRPATASEATAGDREAQRDWQNNFREYTNDIAQKQKAHAEAFRVWAKQNETALPGEETEAPTYTPPSFEEWQALRPEKPAKGGGRGAATGGAAKPQPADPLQAADPATGTIYRFPNKAAADGYRKEKGIQ